MKTKLALIAVGALIALGGPALAQNNKVERDRAQLQRDKEKLRAEMRKIASGSRVKATPEENKAVVDGSIAHAGRYTIDDGGRSITFHIETSTFPNWNGTTQKRPLSLKGDLLTYTVATPSAGGAPNDAVWRRAK